MNDGRMLVVARGLDALFSAAMSSASDDVVVDRRYHSMNLAAFAGTHPVVTAATLPWRTGSYFAGTPDASIRRLVHGGEPRRVLQERRRRVHADRTGTAAG